MGSRPFKEAIDGWLLGSQEFAERVRDRMKHPRHQDEVPAAKRLSNLAPETVISTVAKYYQVSVASFQQRRSGAEARDVAAWLTRRLTTATLRELAAHFGLGHPDSVSNMTRRVDRELNKTKSSKRLREALEDIQVQLKTENRV